MLLTVGSGDIGTDGVRSLRACYHPLGGLVLGPYVATVRL